LTLLQEDLPMATATHVPTFSFDDFCYLSREGRKADLINGVVYLAPPERLDENRLCLWLAELLGAFIRRKGLGNVFVSQVVFRLDDRNGLEPDIAYVREEHRHQIHRKYIDGPPDLAVEIVSPESVERDYEQKRRLYEKAGVAEYWIVDEYLKKLIMLHLDRKGIYHATRPQEGAYQSHVLPGFWLKSEWLWEETRPTTEKVMSQLHF